MRIKPLKYVILIQVKILFSWHNFGNKTKTRRSKKGAKKRKIKEIKR
nr:MAG TPA: hypothetical protein [Caudoviricetes sp.]